MTITGASRSDLDAALPSLSSYRSLVWAVRITVIAVAVWVIMAVGGAGWFALAGLACPVISMFLLLGTVVAVVASQVTPMLPDDSLPQRMHLLGGIIASAGRHALIGIPR